MKYYSQFRQDHFIDWVVFNKKKKGFFIDVGAHNGISFSNTYFFEKNREWEGLCFEPNPIIFKELQANRKSSNLNCCIGNENGIVDFWHIEGPAEMLSGIKKYYDPRHIERIEKENKNLGGVINEIKVEVKSLMEFPEILNRNVDYLSLDTEGNELSVLESINFSKINILAISVENNYKDSRIEDYLMRNGFDKVITLNCDFIFVNRSILSRTLKFRIELWNMFFCIWDYCIRKSKNFIVKISKIF